MFLVEERVPVLDFCNLNGVQVQAYGSMFFGGLAVGSNKDTLVPLICSKCNGPQGHAFVCCCFFQSRHFSTHQVFCHVE